MTRNWPWVIAAWIALALLLRSVAPQWETIAADGDLAYLPPTVASVSGKKQLDEAFPGSRVRSQMMIILANPDQPLAAGDITLGLDLARRLHWYSASAQWYKLPLSKPDWRAENLTIGERARIEAVADNLSQCIEIDDQLARFLEEERPGFVFPRLQDAYQRLARLRQRQGREQEALVNSDITAVIDELAVKSMTLRHPAWAEAVTEVWTWRDAIVGHKLGRDNKNARLLAMHLDNEFTAVANINVLEGVEELIRTVKSDAAHTSSQGLRIEISGSAAVGADMLRASASSVRQTEGVTIFLVIIILTLVYRGPFLVAIPLTSIGLSLIVATSLVALLARSPEHPENGGLGVFTTTRIFIVVLLFGAGTDFCLFFLARCREIVERTPTPTRDHFYRAVGRAWRGVHNAIVASAMTTIVGLAMMWMSRFEKFRFSGPIIAISLAVTLVVCLTFTPALLSAIGRLAFWPALRPGMPLVKVENNGFWNRVWMGVAHAVVGRPALALVATTAALTIPAYYGWHCLGWVTYDFVEELSSDAPSRRGLALTKQFFATNDSSPVTILVIRNTPFTSDDDLRQASDRLSTALYLPGVDAVRSVNDPLGDYPPQRSMSLFNKDAWRRRVLKEHRISIDRYLSPVEAYQNRLARFEVILSDNPFSLDATDTLQRLSNVVNQETQRLDSPWHNARMSTVGTTVGITDLRTVTQADQSRIQILVTLGVWGVLLFLLRHWVLATYLIFTVLFSYFSTLGLTYAFFGWAYGPEYHGLDWKVPLFLFVILVAVGQDYNVYLTTRILEEQQQHGLLEGIRRALGLTGGIITSCGAVMAGTFVAMTSPAVSQFLATQLPWLGVTQDAPVLRGITELGFALSLGVLLDTLVIRSILVPAFFAIWQKPKTV
ncbi:MAG: MMPL family transporter [Pirellulaceae bacterium]|nr:MMPL family transporter [Pirellulaceae bacterium]